MQSQLLQSAKTYGDLRGRDLELPNFIKSLDPDALAEWGKRKSKDFMCNIGYEGYDKEVTAERNKQFVGNIILVRGTNEILQV